MNDTLADTRISGHAHTKGLTNLCQHSSRSVRAMVKRQVTDSALRGTRPPSLSGNPDSILYTDWELCKQDWPTIPTSYGGVGETLDAPTLSGELASSLQAESRNNRIDRKSHHLRNLQPHTVQSSTVSDVTAHDNMRQCALSS